MSAYYGRVIYVRCEYCGTFKGFIGVVDGKCSSCGGPMKMPDPVKDEDAHRYASFTPYLCSTSAVIGSWGTT